MKKVVSIQLIIVSFLWLSSCTVKTAEKAVNKDVLIVEKPALDSSRFDVKRFEENKRKDGTPNYEFVEGDKDIRQWSDTPERDSPDSLKYYVEEISKKWKPFVIHKGYDYKGRLKTWVQTFRLEPMNKSYEYDENGKIIKITNYEERYKHSFADIREILLKEKGIDIYDTRQAIGRRVYHKNPTSKEAYYDIYVLDKNNEEKDYRIVIFDDTLELKEYR
ncbi:hypothetical protein [Chryseobacterium gambrini]|uniref:hypothetical protein n=1 Tax=Chryseobacterium gambrini TaxID=373672 RepID=UPI0022F38F6E|nr:hypothetical protein [Chryseobacterium gambrini]WBX99336.1 hypothetical protein PE065_08815 [Chryseobacterium gambrini]